MSRYIDSEALKAENRKHFPSLTLRCELTYIINDIPAADVRDNVRSEWVKYADGECNCLHCGFVLDDWTQAMFYKYCPNCGAEMLKGGD